MNKPVFFTMPTGDEAVILMRPDYDRLIETAEDAIDIAEAERISREIREGQQEAVPLAVVERLCGDESRLLVWREYRGLSVDELAAAGAVPADVIDGIEASRIDPPVSVLKALATALKVDIDDLIPR